MTEFVSHEMGIANAAINNQFRVFSLKTKTFYPETEEFFLSSAGDCLLTKTGERLDLKENVILACTGVKDIKGRPIFHGDVLKTDEGNWAAAVVWGDGRFCLEDERGGFSACQHMSQFRSSVVQRKPGTGFQRRFRKGAYLSLEQGTMSSELKSVFMQRRFLHRLFFCMAPFPGKTGCRKIPVQMGNRYI